MLLCDALIFPKKYFDVFVLERSSRMQRDTHTDEFGKSMLHSFYSGVYVKRGVHALLRESRTRRRP